ncbi:suppressor of fused domain protein [Vulgatibacter incomptus]|uniref:suppressor of fused domain protein n=1 Tax=Vulgatibacter incomptus TaxID=1391653 RepID=UPI00068140CB
MISVRSMDHAWTWCIGEIVRNYRQEIDFSFGTVLHFGQQISDESPMTSFLIFTSTLLDADEQRTALSEWTIKLSQLYPIYQQEAAVIDEVGVERFFWGLGIDFDDVRRPPVKWPQP